MAVPTGAQKDEDKDDKDPCATCDADKKAKKKKERDAKVAKMTAKLDPQLKADVEKSPELQKDLAELNDKGWTVREDPSLKPPTAGVTNSATKEITLASGSDTGTLAHEVQHALNSESGQYQPPQIGSMSRSDFVSAATQASVQDERSAFGNQNLVRSEILANGGRDIGPVRSFGSLYQDAYTSYYTNAYGKYYDTYAPGGR